MQTNVVGIYQSVPSGVYQVVVKCKNKDEYCAFDVVSTNNLALYGVVECNIVGKDAIAQSIVSSKLVQPILNTFDTLQIILIVSKWMKECGVLDKTMKKDISSKITRYAFLQHEKSECGQVSVEKELN